MRLSRKLGLRVQEIALLQIKEVATVNKSGFKLKEIMKLPASYTKGASPLNRGMLPES